VASTIKLLITLCEKVMKMDTTHKRHRRLSHYMMAIQNATLGYDSAVDNESYEQSVLRRLVEIKRAVADLELFLDQREQYV
jgi:hypothetical protein